MLEIRFGIFDEPEGYDVYPVYSLAPEELDKVLGVGAAEKLVLHMHRRIQEREDDALRDFLAREQARREQYPDMLARTKWGDAFKEGQ